MQFTLTIDTDDAPDGFWQSEPCPTCGSLEGEFCMYNDERVAHTRHRARDDAVMAAARRRAVTPPVVGEPVVPPRRRQ